MIKKILLHSLLSLCLFLTLSCEQPADPEINIGFIAPLSVRAVDLGFSRANAMIIAVEQYNLNKKEEEPRVNIFIEDDQWSADLALPTYEKLKKKHAIDVLFISNTDGLHALADKLLEDKMIAINPLNNDGTLSNINENVIRIAKSTEEANALIAKRMIERGLKKPFIFQYPNEFMTMASQSITKVLKEAGVECIIETPPKDEVDFTSYLFDARSKNCDSYVFLGYKEYGHAMQQARDHGITAPFFGSTVLLDPWYFKNSSGEIIGTECCFFTPKDGNLDLANTFLKNYEKKFGNTPISVWPPMQAYDAMNILLEALRTFEKQAVLDPNFDDLLRAKLLNVKNHKGVCGNISINEDGSSTGIQFSMYRYFSNGHLVAIED